jgi:hypothetical protein
MFTISDGILILNLFVNTVIFYVAARLYLLPLIPRLRPQQIVAPILLLHSTRHLEMMFFKPRLNLSGIAVAVRIPGSIRRFDNGHTGGHDLL